MRVARILPVLAAALLLVAGCGGGGSTLSKSQYEKRIQADGQAVQTAVKAVSAATTSLSALAKQVDSAEAAVKKAADDLDSLTPPKDAAADNAKIVAGLRAIGKGLDALKRAAKKGSASDVQAAALSLSDSPEIRAAQRAATDLKKKGYSIGVIGT